MPVTTICYCRTKGCPLYLSGHLVSGTKHRFQKISVWCPACGAPNFLIDTTLAAAFSTPRIIGLLAGFKDT